MIRYKRNQVLEILEINIDTLRYWREALDPVKRRKTYSVRCILAFKIISILIKTHGISVNHLKKFNCEIIFIWCDELDHTILEDIALIVDNRNSKFIFKRISYGYRQTDFQIHVVPIAELIEDFKQSFFFL